MLKCVFNIFCVIIIGKGRITMKKMFIILFVGLLFVVACDSKKSVEPKNTTSPSPTSTETVSKEQIHEHCVRDGSIKGGSTDLSYEVYYTGDRLNRVESKETVISEQSSILDTYEEAYRTIHANYKDVDYYYTEVIREDDRVTSIIQIDYDHVDADTLLDLEGDENNVYENKIPKIAKFKVLGQKVGMICTKVS